MVFLTNLPSNRFSQTQQRNVNTQSTNTPSQNQISTLNERCQCEDDEMDHTGIQYRSDFARQLQQSETMPKYYTQHPVSNYISHTEKPNISQTESSTIYHIPKEAISHTQKPALQYTSQKAIHPLPNQHSIQHTEPSTISNTQQ